jgi:hypothetical protein
VREVIGMRRTGLFDTLMLAEGKMHVTTAAFILMRMLTETKQLQD